MVYQKTEPYFEVLCRAPPFLPLKLRDYWKTAFTAALLGFLGAYLIGGYLNMPDAGAIVAIAYVGGRILWYLKRLEARQEPKDTVADAPADTAAADTTPEGSGTEG